MGYVPELFFSIISEKVIDNGLSITSLFYNICHPSRYTNSYEEISYFFVHYFISHW